METKRTTILQTDYTHVKLIETANIEYVANLKNLYEACYRNHLLKSKHKLMNSKLNTKYLHTFIIYNHKYTGDNRPVGC